MADRFNNRALSAFTTLIAACSVFLYLVSSTTTTVTSLSTHQPHMADYPILRNLRPPAGAVACDRWWECAGPKRYHVGFGDHHSAQRMARWLVRRSLCWRAPPPTPPRGWNPYQASRNRSDAVTQTDMLQSVVLIFAFVCIPSTYAYYYGSLAGAADSFGCEYLPCCSLNAHVS